MTYCEMDLNQLRENPQVSIIKATIPGKLIIPDLWRMVASIEEVNAEFEGFLIRDYPERPDTLIGYPVRYDDSVQENEVFGGMWSDYKDDQIQHPSAFVRLTFKEKA